MRAGLAMLIYLACVGVPFLRVADGAGLYMLIAAVRPQDITYGLYTLGGRYSILCLGCICLGWAIRLPKLRPRWGAFHGLLIVFGLHMIVCRVFAIDATAAAYQFSMIFIPIVVSLIFVQVIRTEMEIYRATWLLAIGLGFLGWWAAWKYHFTDYYDMETDGELTGPGGMLVDRNDFGMGLCMGVPLLFYVGLSAKRTWAKVLAIASTAPNALTILETGSRGAFLALGAVGCYILYKMHHKRWLLGLAVVAVAGGFVVMPPEFRNRIMGIRTAAQEDTSAQGRLTSWRASMEMARQHPLTGVGLGCFTVDYFRYAPDAPEAFVAHSSFFQILGTAGIPGAVLWVLLVVRMWQVLTKNERRLRRARMRGSRLLYITLGLKTSLVAYVVAGSFLSMEDLEFWYYELALTASLDHAVRAEIARRRAKEEAKEAFEEEPPTHLGPFPHPPAAAPPPAPPVVG